VKLQFFPWNGSKRWLLDHLIPIINQWSGEGRYIEPFVGSGSISYAVRQIKPNVPQIIADANPWLSSVFKYQTKDSLDFIAKEYSIEEIEKWRSMSDNDLKRLTTEEQVLRFAICLFTAWGNRWKTEDDGRFTNSSTPVNPKFCDPEKLKKTVRKIF